MPLISGIYDSDPIQPVAKIRENLSIWTSGKWQHYRINNSEPMPRSRPIQVDVVALSGATTIAANATINATLLAVFNLDEKADSKSSYAEFLQLRWEAIDDIEGVLWEQNSVGRFTIRAAQARVGLTTPIRDPWCATTTFFVLGRDRNAFLSVVNPLPVAQPSARFAFWGYRYSLQVLSMEDARAVETGRMQSTWLPAEGFGVGAG